MEKEKLKDINIVRKKLAKAEEALSTYRRRDGLAQQIAKIGYWEFTPPTSDSTSTGDLRWSSEVVPLLSGLVAGELASITSGNIRILAQ
jgi:hypothetical protein